MSGIGLAYKTPDQQRVATLDTVARSASQPGIGMARPTISPDDFDGGAPVMDVLDPEAMPTAPLDLATLSQLPSVPEPASAADPNKLIDFENNALGSIGLILSEFGAGVRGLESPAAKMRQQKLEQAAMDYKTAALAMDVVDKTSKFVARLPASQRKDAIADLDARFSPALGGQSIAPFLTAMTTGDEAQTAARMGILKEMGVTPAQMAYFGQNPDAAVDFIDKALEHKATTKTPDEIKKERMAQNEADATKPMTPAEKAADQRSREANAASRANADATRLAAADQRGTSQENTLRGEFTTQSKNFITIRDANQKINEAAKNAASDKTGAADMSLVFGYMKMLDPTSTVREGEYANAANSGGVGARIMGLYNKALEGKLLTPAQRADFQKNAKRIYDKSLANQKDLANRYTDIASRSGANPQNVIVDYTSVDDPLGLR